MNVYDDFAISALDGISEYGMSVTVKRTPIASSDPVQGTVTPDTVQTFVAKAIVLPSSNGRVLGFDDKTEGGSSVFGHRKFLIMAAEGTDFQPKTGDKIILTGDADEWTVGGSTAVSPAGVDLVYRMGITK